MIRIDDILHCTARYYGLSEDDILSESRHHIQTEARHVVMYLSKEMTPCSLKEIAMGVGRKEHGAAIHGIGRIENDMRIPRIATAVERVRAMVLTREKYGSGRMRGYGAKA